MRSYRSYLLPCFLSGLIPVFSWATDEPIAVMDLEALMSLDVQATSVMKRVESVFDTPASIYVLSEEQIRLSGASNLTEAVSLLPGIYYRQINNNQRAVSIRKDPDTFSSGFLVMIDGRYIYNPMFPGTIWEHLEIPLNNIDRIELIRGSGGTLWSSKANSGVINIITKHSVDTQGFEVIAGTGSQGKRITDLRYGGLFGSGGSYRFNLSTRHNGESGDYLEPAHDGHSVETFYTRWDYTFNDDLSLMVKGAYLDADGDVTFNKVNLTSYAAEPFETQYLADKKSLMVRLDHRVSATRTQLLQLAYSDGAATLDTLNGELQLFNINYSMNTLYEHHKLDWGLEYQLNTAKVTESEYFEIKGGGSSRLENYAFYIQDEYELRPDSTYLTGSVRVDSDPITGIEYQPSLRIMQQIGAGQRIWGAISRSVITPTDLSTRVSLLGHSVVPIPNYLTGSEDFDTEEYDNVEVGYRGQHENVEIDASAFYNHSDNSVSIESVFTGSFPVFTRVDNILSNNAEVIQKGAELVLNFQPQYNWSLQLSLSYLDQDIKAATGYTAVNPSMELKQIALRSDYKHTPELSSYAMLTYKSGMTLPAVPGVERLPVADHSALDAGVTWQVNPELELGLYGKNLLGAYVDYPSSELSQTYSTEIEPSVLLRAIWAL